MEKIPAMTDMKRSRKEKSETLSDMATPAMVSPDVPDYPWGLSISMCEEELEKLGLDEKDMSVGDIYHFHALVKVTSVSSNEYENGKHCRVEFQITHLSGESEDEENEEAEEKTPHDKRRARLYKG